MEEFTYEVITGEFGGEIIKRTNAEGDIWWIPKDLGNVDYIAYLESLNDNTETE